MDCHLIHIHGLPTTGLNNPNALNPTLNIDFTAPRAYALTITDQRGCSVITRDTVNPNPSLIVSAGSDETVCKGSIVTLGGMPTAVGGTMPYVYAWSPTTGLSSSVIANPSITIQQTQLFVCTVTDARGCVKQDTVLISMHPNLIAQAGNDKVICMNAKIRLEENHLHKVEILRININGFHLWDCQVEQYLIL